MLSLVCPAQNYAWGRPAERSEVAQLAKSNGVTLDDGQPYAELWMGTHPSGPAVIAGEGTTLKDWISAHPEALGDAVHQRFGGDLPFLFKVLSVQTALSIQSHPDKKLAEKLHANNPKDYKDANHKPEMALALEDFEALCGFIDPKELKQVLGTTPELAACVGEAATATVLSAEDDAATKQALKGAFTALMTAEAGAVAGAISALVARLKEEAAAGRALGPKERLVLRLNEQYPGDVGVLSAFFLNLVSLQAGQAIFLAANEPHAYVSGELVECMATSDNVIRAGLTPKFRDTQVLCESLTYNTGLPEVLAGEAIHDHVKVFRPPFEEFEVQLVEVPAGEQVAVPVNPGPLMLLVQQGGGALKAAGGRVADEALRPQTDLHRGNVLFVPAGTTLTYSASASSPLRVWVAACNAKVFAPVPSVQAEEAAAAAAVAEPSLVAA